MQCAILVLVVCKYSYIEMVNVNPAEGKTSTLEKRSNRTNKATTTDAFDSVRLSLFKQHDKKLCSTRVSEPTITPNRRAGTSLYRALRTFSRKSAAVWHSDLITSISSVSLWLIGQFVNNPSPKLLSKVVGISNSPHLKRLALTSMIKSHPTMVPNQLERLLDGDCKDRFSLAVQLLHEARGKEIPELFQFCTPTYFGIQDKTLQQALYTSILEQSSEYRGENFLQRRDIEVINNLDTSFRTQVYAWILETKGVFPSDSKKIKLSQDQYIEAYRIFLDRMIERPDRFYKSALHSRAYETPIENPEARLSLFSSFYEAMPKMALQSIEHFELDSSSTLIKSELVRKIYDDGYHDALFGLNWQSVTEEVRNYILRDCLLRKPDLVFHFPIAPWFPLSPSLTSQFFLSAINSRHWDRAVEIVELSQQPDSSRSTATDRLQGCKRMLESLEPAGSSHQLSSFQKLVNANITPSDFLNGALHSLGQQHEDFLIRIVATYGETFGSSVLHELRRIIKGPDALDEREKLCILDFLATGFRGFSEVSYKLFRDLWQESSRMALHHVEEWKELSRCIISNQRLSNKQVSHPIYLDCVYAAYRPVGIPRCELPFIIDGIRDYSKHLKGMTLQEGGYHLSVRKGDATDKPAQGHPRAAIIKSTLESVYSPGNDYVLSLTEFKAVLLLLLKGDIDAARRMRSSILSSLVAQAPSHPATALYKEVKSALETSRFGSNPRASMQAALELQESAFSDLIFKALPQITTALGLTISPFVQKHVRRILSLTSQRNISYEELCLALEKQLASLFSQDSFLLKQEMRKVWHTQSDSRVSLMGYVTKSPHSFLGRAAAGLCTALDTTSWRDKNWFQMNIFEPSSNRFIGNIQFHRFATHMDGEALLARFNPTSKALLELDGDSLANELIQTAFTIASANGWRLYIPENTDHHLLSNRPELASRLEGYQAKELACEIQLSEFYVCNKAYEVRPSR